MKEVSFGLDHSLFEKWVVVGQKFLPYKPQDQRSRSDPYLDIPPSTGVSQCFVVPLIRGGFWFFSGFSLHDVQLLE